MGGEGEAPVLAHFFDEDGDMPLFTPMEETLDTIVATLRGIDARMLALETKFAEVFDAPATEKRLRKARRPGKTMKLSCKRCRDARAACSHGTPCVRCAGRKLKCVYQQGVRKKRTKR